MNSTRESLARSSLARSWPLALAAVSVVACAAPVGSDDSASQRVISGSDDRAEVYAEENAWMRSYAEQATAAFVHRSFFGTVNGRLTLSSNGTALGVGESLCAGEPYAEQPQQANCSGTLIDDDLILTAGHCVTAANACTDYRWVFNNHYVAPGVRHVIEPEDIFSCRRIEVMHVGDINRGEADYAIIRLDRSAVPRFQPAPVRRVAGPLDRGQHVKVVGFPDGILAKIDTQGNVFDDTCLMPDSTEIYCNTCTLPDGTLTYCEAPAEATRTGYFRASLDVFGGNSGGGVYESDGYTLAGVLIGAGTPEGNSDYVPRDPDGGTCNVRRVCATQDCPTARVIHVAPALAALCADPSRSQRLCGTGAPRNDSCVNAEPIDVQYGEQQTLSGSMVTATFERRSACETRARNFPDVFYRFTLAAPAIFYTDAFTSDIPVALGLTSTCGPYLINIMCSASACGDDKGQFALRLSAGTYYLHVASRTAAAGRYNVHVQFLPASDVAGAIPLSAGPPTVPSPVTGRRTGGWALNTNGATDRAQGTCGGAGNDHTFFFSTCPAFRGGTVRAWTTGTAWDTVVHFSQGNSPVTACNDNASATTLTSVMRADVAPGSGVHAIYVDGNAGQSGDYSMQYSIVPN